MPAYETYMSEGKAFRLQKRLAEAQARFYSAEAEVPQNTLPYAFARFYSGWTWQDRAEYAKSVQALEDAYVLLDNLPDEQEWAAFVGGVLGLSYLALHRYADAVRVLEKSDRRYQAMKGKDELHAMNLHNLAMALTRGGDPVRGLATATRALELRELVSGSAHPMTVDTRLIEAYARIDSGDLEGAGAQIRQAARAILVNVGESHSYFADALLTEARRVARMGDGCAAEALARRAMFLHRMAGTSADVIRQREQDAAELGRLWRTGSGAKDAGDVALWRVRLQHTLRRYQVDTLDFAPSGDRPKEWFFFVPAGWPPAQVRYACRLVFAEANQTLNSREPSDPHFLDATQAEAQAPVALELAATEFSALFARKVWEPTVAFSVAEGTRAVPLGPGDFARALAARGVPDAALLPLQGDAAALGEARAHPVEILRSVLFP